MNFSIRRSRAADAPHLPYIERSAGALYRSVPELAWISQGADMPVERHLELIAASTSWIAEVADGSLAAFLCAEVMGNSLHVWELAVMLHHQRKGIGRALMLEAIDFARQRQLGSVTLTTFRAIPWNEPAYRRIGFETLPANGGGPRLTAILRREAEAGLPPERRCAMRFSLKTANAI